MSLARAFTTRRKEPELQISAPMYIGRAATHRGGRPVQRNKISAPVALVSTSNALLNNAQDIPGTSPVEMRNVDIRNISYGSVSSSSSGAEDSDASTGSIHSNDNLTDASSVDGSPVSPDPEPNHLSCYFKPGVNTYMRSPSHSPSMSGRASFDAPLVPQRVPSHSKKAHETLHRKRSIQRMMSPPPSTAREAHHERARSSVELFSPTKSAFVEAPKESPFGSELAQLDEVAEEFGHVVRDAEADAESVFLQAHGLALCSASDYMNEIESLIYEMLAPEQQDFGGWI